MRVSHKKSHSTHESHRHVEHPGVISAMRPLLPKTAVTPVPNILYISSSHSVNLHSNPKDNNVSFLRLIQYRIGSGRNVTDRPTSSSQSTFPNSPIEDSLSLSRSLFLRMTSAFCAVSLPLFSEIAGSSRRFANCQADWLAGCQSR